MKMTIQWIAGILLLGTFLTSANASEFSDKIRASYDSENLVPTEIFKIRDLVEVHYFAPASPRILGNNPAQIYIHGGAWKGGSPTSSYRWCRYLAEHGVSAFTIRYQRSNEAKGIKPTECLKDTKTAMRWVRANATRFGINPNQIAAAGNSAGAHLATALATIKGYNAPSDDLSISCRPNLLLLGSPVIDNGPGGYGNGWDEALKNKQTKDYRVKDFWEDFSPVHNLNHNLPPSLVLMGDQDPLISIQSVNLFGQAVEASGSDFEWIVFPEKGHGLFSQVKSYLTPELMHIYYAFHQFLAKHGYMDPPLTAGDEVRTLVHNQPLSDQR
ncbi:alpha/beta hydrolase [Coraliomargarita sp. W4R72]